MSSEKKEKKMIAEVHVLGDLKDVAKLVDLVNRKKTLVIFRNGEDGALYAEVERSIIRYSYEDVAKFKKEYKIIYFDFFPSQKKTEVAKEKVEKPEGEKNKEKKEKKGKKEKVKSEKTKVKS